MENENMRVEVPVVDDAADMSVDYISAINEIKANSVSRDKYNEAIAENRKLIKALTNGDSFTAVEATPRKTAAECREEFIKPSKSQCEYLEKVLALREAVIEEGGNDPMVTISQHVKPTIQHFQRSQEIADIYREILDYANGNDKVLINELQRRMI